MRPGRLAGRYPAAAAMVVFALIPYLALSAALQPLTPIIARDLHTSLQTMSLGYGLANAGYAVGTVLAVALAQHLPQRRLLVVYAGLLVVGLDLDGDRPEPGDVHRRARAPGALHEPDADRGGAAAWRSASAPEAARDGGDHEPVHLRRGRARPDNRRDPGPGRRAGGRCSSSSPAISLAALVLIAADLRGRPAGRPRARRSTRSRSRSPPAGWWPLSSAPRSC